MKKVLVLYTGGTIGMKTTTFGLTPEANLQDLLAQKFTDEMADTLPDYDVIESEQLIDSSNLVPSDWTKIAQALAEQWQNYCGFVVLHGTDTMAYTASALSYIFRNTNKPIILTGAQLPLREPGNDGLGNLAASLMVAANHPVTEVCICFNGRLLRGNRSIKLNSVSFDAFHSPNFPQLGKVGRDIQLATDLFLPEEPAACFEVPTFQNHSVAVITVYPGIDTSWINQQLASEKLGGLILQTYGSGNPPDRNETLIQTLAGILN